MFGAAGAGSSGLSGGGGRTTTLSAGGRTEPKQRSLPCLLWFSRLWARSARLLPVAGLIRRAPGGTRAARRLARGLSRPYQRHSLPSTVRPRSTRRGRGAGSMDGAERHQHRGGIAASPGARAGSKVTTWVNASGQPAGAPLSDGQVARQGVAAGVVASAGVALLLLGAWLLARNWLDRRRLAAWEAAWRLTARAGSLPGDPATVSSAAPKR